MISIHVRSDCRRPRSCTCIFSHTHCLVAAQQWLVVPSHHRRASKVNFRLRFCARVKQSPSGWMNWAAAAKNSFENSQYHSRRVLSVRTSQIEDRKKMLIWPFLNSPGFFLLNRSLHSPPAMGRAPRVCARDWEDLTKCNNALAHHKLYRSFANDNDRLRRLLLFWVEWMVNSNISFESRFDRSTCPCVSTNYYCIFAQTFRFLLSSFSKAISMLILS